jgi:hypothetical protein
MAAVNRPSRNRSRIGSSDGRITYDFPCVASQGPCASCEGQTLADHRLHVCTACLEQHHRPGNGNQEGVLLIIPQVYAVRVSVGVLWIPNPLAFVCFWWEQFISLIITMDVEKLGIEHRRRSVAKGNQHLVAHEIDIPDDRAHSPSLPKRTFTCPSGAPHSVRFFGSSVVSIADEKNRPPATLAYLAGGRATLYAFRSPTQDTKKS